MVRGWMHCHLLSLSLVLYIWSQIIGFGIAVGEEMEKCWLSNAFLEANLCPLSGLGTGNLKDNNGAKLCGCNALSSSPFNTHLHFSSNTWLPAAEFMCLKLYTKTS